MNRVETFHRLRYRITAALIVGTQLFAFAAHAGQPEAREAARNANCPPKKIEVYQQSLGGEGHVVYRVQCTLPKTVGTADSGDAAAGVPDALLIGCDQNLCRVLRAVADEKK